MKLGDCVRLELQGREFIGYLKEARLDHDMYSGSELTLEFSLDHQGSGPSRPGVTVRSLGEFNDHIHGVGLRGLRPRPITTEANCVKAAHPEVQMDKYTVTVVRDRKTKSALIYVQLKENAANGNEQYLIKLGEAPVERGVGEEMPLYAKFPDELFIPLLNAVNKTSEYRDAARDTYA